MLYQRLTKSNILPLQKFLGSACGYCSKEQQKPKWRTPVAERPDEWYSSLSVFQTKRGPNMDWLTFVQLELDLRPSAVKKWWKRFQEQKTIFEERYIPERHKILGGDLAAAHFIVHRGGGVRFFGNEDWIRQNEDDEYDLPKFYNPAYSVEAIDASNMKIHFEGLGNLLDLYRIKWLSFNGCPNIDDWCLDRISGAYPDSLEYLDVRNCPKITARGLASLYRLRKLEKLIVSGNSGDKNVDVVCLMLQDLLPDLEIEGIQYLPLSESVENSDKGSSESKTV